MSERVEKMLKSKISITIVLHIRTSLVFISVSIAYVYVSIPFLYYIYYILYYILYILYSIIYYILYSIIYKNEIQIQINKILPTSASLMTIRISKKK